MRKTHGHIPELGLKALKYGKKTIESGTKSNLQ
jgi:hypothetical protein